MILAQAAGLDNRRVTDAMVVIWHAAFQGYTYDEVKWAFMEHVRTSTDYLVPALLIQIVNHKRAEYRMMNPSAPLTADAWMVAVREEEAAVANVRRLRAEGRRSAVEAMDSGDYDEAGA